MTSVDVLTIKIDTGYVSSMRTRNSTRENIINNQFNSIVPVGHIWKFDLEKTFSLDFGVKCNFSKIRIEHVMLKFLAKTENTRKIRSEESNNNRGKVVKIAAGNCYSQFPIHNSNESRAVLSLAEGDREWRRKK